MIQVNVEDRYDEEEVFILDRTSLDPTLHYRFVRDDPQAVARRRSQGYRIVSRKEDKVKTLIDMSDIQDDQVRVGDTILMCCPRVRFENRVRRKADVVRERIGATSERVREKIDRAKAAGLPVEITQNYTDKGEGRDE